MPSLLRKVILTHFLVLGSLFPGRGQTGFSSSNLPIVVIETGNSEILDDPRIVANMGIIHNGLGERNDLTDGYNDYDGLISIEIRGSSSQRFPKKQYALETQFADGSNRNVSLLGMPEENDWILSAPYSDKSLMRNVLAYSLSRKLGRYAPRTRFCELVLNGDYRGIYVLTEKIKRDDSRVDISNLSPDEVTGNDLTGGYILKIDKTTGSGCGGWRTDIQNVLIQHEYPDCGDIAPEQEDYINGLVSDFEKALFLPYFSNPDVGYRKYLEVPAAVDFLMVNEISKNIDAYFLSTFLHKAKGENKKLVYGPVWDFNLAFGNAFYFEGFDPQDLQADTDLWWYRLLQDSTFSRSLKQRWTEVRSGVWSDQVVFDAIDSIANLLDESQQRNFDRWPVLGTYVRPNYFIGNTYAEEVDYVRAWLQNRLSWLDAKFGEPGSYQADAEDFEVSAYPNPFTDFLKYRFTLKEKAKVSITVYDGAGRTVAILVDDKEYPKGSHIQSWNLTGLPPSVSEGYYMVALTVDGRITSLQRLVKMARH